MESAPADKLYQSQLLDLPRQGFSRSLPLSATAISRDGTLCPSHAAALFALVQRNGPRHTLIEISN
jgi:hypothetical protein